MNTNLPKLLNELLRTMTQKEIAARVGTSQPTIHRIRTGRQHPAYDLGRRIVQLHAEVIGSGEEAA